jgi:hypothetical protein
LRDDGGALINVGSVLSDRAIPLQGMYCASKHAVKGYTDALRMELKKHEIPISVTLIKPSAIDTPYYEHATSHLNQRARAMAPVYSPYVVARAILHAASNPSRDITVGGAGRVLSLAGTLLPRLTDRLMIKNFFKGQTQESPPTSVRQSNLYHSPSGREPQDFGDYSGHVIERSLYTDLASRGVFGLAVGFFAGILGAAFFVLKNRKIKTATRQESDPQDLAA